MSLHLLMLPKELHGCTNDLFRLSVQLLLLDCTQQLRDFNCKEGQVRNNVVLKVVLDTVKINLKHITVSWAVWPDRAIYWILGNFLKPLATIKVPKSSTFLGNLGSAFLFQNQAIFFFPWARFKWLFALPFCWSVNYSKTLMQDCEPIYGHFGTRYLYMSQY